MVNYIFDMSLKIFAMCRFLSFLVIPSHSPICLVTVISFNAQK